MKRYLIAIIPLLAFVHDPSHAQAPAVPRQPTGVWSINELDTGRTQVGVTHVQPAKVVDILRRVKAARPKGSTVVQYDSPDLDPTTIGQLGTPSDQCSGRFAGPFGVYLNGPQLVSRLYNGLDVPDGTQFIGTDGCFSSLFQYGYEFRGPQGPASMVYDHLRMNLTILVNGFVAQGNLLQHDPVVFDDVSAFDGTVDFFGPSGRSGLTQPLGTFIAFDIPVTPETIDLWRHDFQVSALMRMNGSTESSSAPNSGYLDGFWRGGVTFAVATP